MGNTDGIIKLARNVKIVIGHNFVKSKKSASCRRETARWFVHVVRVLLSHSRSFKDIPNYTDE